MICKRGAKGLVMLLLLLSLTFLFSATASAATVEDVANNSLRIGDDIYELNSTTGYTYENVLASLDRGGPRYYFKIGNRWYDLTRKDINTLSDLLDLEKAVPAAEVRTWRLDYRYGRGDIPETMEPVLSTYNFGYEFTAGTVLAEEDINVTVDLYTDEQGAAGYDAAYIAFSAEGPGDVTFKIVGGDGENSFENGGALDPFTLPADYTDSAEWALCFSGAGDYTITFKLMDLAAGEAIAEGIREITVYPSRETVLAELEACILEALDVLELEETGVSDIEYAEKEALVHIDEPGRAVAEFVQSLAGAFRGPCAGVAGVVIYVNGGEAGAIENPVAMSDAELIEAIGRELIGSLTGSGQGWGEAVLGDLEGKSADVELNVARGAAQYSAIYEVNFAVNQYSVAVTAENGAVEGAGSYAVGAEVGLEATANAEYEFYSWSGVEGAEVSRSNPYTFAMPNRDVELYANIFRAEAIIEQDRTLVESYMGVEVAADDVTLDLGGNTVVHLSITGSNVTLKNGTVVNLEIGRGVENVVLEDISDGDGGNHYFAGGGSDSVVLRGQVLLKGTVHITSREALGICSQSAEAVIGGDLFVETIMPVAIAAPVQGEVRLLAFSESITINAEVSRIVALADAMIKISSGIDEPMRPQVERAAGVEVTVSIVDEHGEETGDAEDVGVGEGLSPAARFIFSIAPVADEIKVSGSYTLPPAVEAVLSDRTREDVPVVWCPPVADTAEDGVFPFSGTVEGYDEAVELTLTVYKTHLVSFEVDGGSAVGEQEIRHGRAATEPAAPTREGYTFDGWYKDKALNHAWDFSEDRVTETLTLYARWAANTYEVTFDANGGGGPTPLRMSVTYDHPYGDLAVTAREGYTFAGWFTTKAVGGRRIIATDSVSTAGDHTLYALWNINQYTIIFDSAGGSEIAPLTQDYDTAIIAPPDPEMEGYDFMGWQPELPERMPAENLELTAQWEIKTYAVTFLDYDGTVLDTQTVAHGSAATAPDDPEREGYTFTGWDSPFEEITGELTVTALYKAIDYTLTIQYEYADGSEAVGSHIAVHHIGDCYAVDSPLLTGYTADRLTVSGIMPADDVTVTVIYTINCYTVTFVDHDGTMLDTQTVEHGSDATTPDDPEREGYTFTGWDKVFAGVTGDLTVTAHYVINEYTVTFVDHDGTVLDTQTVAHGSAATAPDDPERDGYTFTGWDPPFEEITGELTVTAIYKAIDYTLTIHYEYADGGEAEESHIAVHHIGDSYAVESPLLTGYTADRLTVSGSMPAGDVTVTVTYTINRYTVTFVDHDGTLLETQTVEHGSDATTPSDPEREGYTFTGWDKVFAGVTGDLTVTAVYVINEYTVTFVDHDGTVLETQTVEHGSAATAPDGPEREGYTFTGWDTCFAEVKSDLTVTAKYINQVLAVLKEMIESAETRTRPGYTDGIAEWDFYWNGFIMALGNANQIYEELEEADPLTGEQITSVTAAKKDLQRAVEILDGIEDFDLALGGREHPKGLVETVYERSLVDSDNFQPGRIRCYYEKESGKFYWMLSGFVQKQGLYEGTTGTGMNPGLQNVMLSESIVKLQSGEHVVEIYDKDGNRKNKTELENEGIALATYWLTEANITTWIYASLVGLVEDCKLIGRTSDGVEFTRTYSFRFVDGGTYLFDRHFRYCVVEEVVQKDFEGYDIINVTRGLKYTGDPIQAVIEEADPGDFIHVAAKTFNENIIINKSINLIGSYREGAISTVLSGEGIDGAPGISIAEGVGGVSIRGFEIKGFASGGISGEGGGISGITIEDNFIHDVGGDAVHGGAGAAQTSAEWTVAGNRIEDFGGSGISFENVGDLEISNNRIARPADSDGFAVGVTVQGDSGDTTVSEITITDNEITGGAVNVTARASGSGTVTASEVKINGNTIAGGSVEVQCGAEIKSATIEDVNINDNNIAYPDKAVTVGTLAYPGAAHVRTVTIKNNEMTGRSTGIDLPQESGYNNLRNFTITGNSLTITDPERAGCAVNLAGVKSSSSFTNNTITVTGSAGGAFNGIDILGKDTGTWTLTDNELIGNNAGSVGSGICLGDDLQRVTLNINKNRITGWAQGVLAGDLAAGATVKFQRNLIYGNTGYGISNGSGATIEATLNYWGHASGPQHSTNPEGLGNTVSDNVDFDPWYLDEDFVARSDGAVHNARLGKYYRDIQSAVDDAAAGDTIKVRAGVFNESLTITKSITLTGVTGDSKTAGPGANAPIIDGSGKGDDVSGIIISGEDAKNIVIEGFEIRNFQGVQSSGVIGCGESVSNVTIRYNYIHDVADHAICVYNADGAEAVAGWNVAYNKIEDSGDSGICFENVSESLISKNEIANPGDLGNAVLIKGCPGDAGSEITIENIKIEGNTIECASRAVAWQAEAGEQSVLKNFAIRDNTIISATGIHAGGLLENVEITGNSITSRYCGAENLGNVNGIGIFSDNTVEMTGNDTHAGIWISGDGAAEWIIENNVLNGNGIGVVGLKCSDVPTSMKIDMYRNTVTGWACGVSIITEDIEVTLRSNLIYDNCDWGVFGLGSFVDATLNYWGDETGPWPEGDGNGVSGDIDFDPWYIDVDCTVASDHEINDQDNVDAAIAKVPAQIASVELPYGDNAGDEEKKAAVKAYIENLEGMAVLRVTVTVEDGSSSGYKVTITRGEAIPGIKDNVKVTFVAPPADREAAKIVEEMIDDLPLAKNVNIDNYLDYLAEVEEAEAAYNALTEPQKALVNEYLVGKLLDLLNKIEELISE